MSLAGYVYVLINLSMPGLAKVGKTGRTPVGRAAELSGATGVATPFAVVFHTAFADMHAAEKHAHASLGARGFRVAANREFFQVDSTAAIEAVLSAPGRLEGGIPEEVDDDEDSAPLADQIFDRAMDFMLGFEDTLEDVEKGLDLLHKAASLGHVEAMKEIASHHAHEFAMDERQRDKSIALKFYTQAADQDDAEAWFRLKQIYDLDHNYQNGAKCLARFLKLAFEGPQAQRGIANCIIDIVQEIPWKKPLFQKPMLIFEGSEQRQVVTDLIRKFDDSVEKTWMTRRTVMINDQMRLRNDAIANFLVELGLRDQSKGLR